MLRREKPHSARFLDGPVDLLDRAGLARRGGQEDEAGEKPPLVRLDLSHKDFVSLPRVIESRRRVVNCGLLDAIIVHEGEEFVSPLYGQLPAHIRAEHTVYIEEAHSRTPLSEQRTEVDKVV